MQFEKEKRQKSTNLFHRNQLWQEKKEKWVAIKEKEQSQRDTKECTFHPRIGSTSPAKSFAGDEFYERNLIWSEQIKSSIKFKQEKKFEEITVIFICIAILIILETSF